MRQGWQDLFFRTLTYTTPRHTTPAINHKSAKYFVTDSSCQSAVVAVTAVDGDAKATPRLRCQIELLV